MLTTVLVVIGTVCVVLALSGILKSVVRHEKLGNEIKQRLELLEDRFYNPENYNNAFIRPLGKKKDNGKEG